VVDGLPRGLVVGDEVRDADRRVLSRELEELRLLAAPERVGLEHAHVLREPVEVGGDRGARCAFGEQLSETHCGRG